MTAALTQRQAEVYAHICQMFDSKGLTPTRQELTTHFGFRSTNAADSHIKALERKGYITTEPFKARTIVIKERQ